MQLSCNNPPNKGLLFTFKRCLWFIYDFSQLVNFCLQGLANWWQCGKGFFDGQLSRCVCDFGFYGWNCSNARLGIGLLFFRTCVAICWVSNSSLKENCCVHLAWFNTQFPFFPPPLPACLSRSLHRVRSWHSVLLVKISFLIIDSTDSDYLERWRKSKISNFHWHLFNQLLEKFWKSFRPWIVTPSNCMPSIACSTVALCGVVYVGGVYLGSLLSST